MIQPSARSGPARRGLEDVDQGRTVSHEEVRREVESWDGWALDTPSRLA